MASETEAAEETRVCGVTSFAAPPAPTYRYVLACQSGKLKVHLVDVATMKEWCSGYLTEDKYMTSRNRIGNGTLTDYVALFQDSLDFLMDASEYSQDLHERSDSGGETSNSESRGSLERSDEDNPPVFEAGRIRRKLATTANGGLELELTVKFKAVRSAWSAKYVFKLEPLSLDRVDRLEGKVLHLEDRLAAAEARLAAKPPQNATLLEVSSGRNVQLTKKGFVKWDEIKEGAFELVKQGLAVQFHVAGVYVVSVKVFLTPQQAGGHVDVTKNEEGFMWDRVPLNAKRKSSVSLVQVASFNENDDLMVAVTRSPKEVTVEVTAAKVGE